VVDGLIVEILAKEGISPIVSVPCNMLAGILNKIAGQSLQHIPVCREEEGVGIAAGAALTGKKPLLLMQNSGLGNCINALMSLTHLYKLPLFLLMSHRGGPREKISAQIPMGHAAPKLLQTLGIDYISIKRIDELPAFNLFLQKTFNEDAIKAALLSEELWDAEK
jgi:sulfopyruvate decarboxylase subunit alpha